MFAKVSIANCFFYVIGVIRFLHKNRWINRCEKRILKVHIHLLLTDTDSTLLKVLWFTIKTEQLVKMMQEIWFLKYFCSQNWRINWNLPHKFSSKSKARDDSLKTQVRLNGFGAIDNPIMVSWNINPEDYLEYFIEKLIN